MLSYRLQAIADMVPEVQTLADIGTDHGYLPIALILDDRIKHGYAMDINRGPLGKAAENIKTYKLEEKIDTLLSNGLENLPEGVECIVIAGMGGNLIRDIIEAYPERILNRPELILSPHLDTEIVRKCIHNIGYHIVKEAYIKDQDKHYPIIHCVYGEEHIPYTELEYLYGRKRCLVDATVWTEYLSNSIDFLWHLHQQLEVQGTSNTRDRCAQIQQEIASIKEVLSWN